MVFSDKNEAHCSYYVVLDIQGGHGTWSCNLSTGNNRKNQHVHALALG